MIRTAVVILIGFFLVSCSSQEEREAKACADTGMAYAMSQKFVKNILKAPSTAKFPLISDENVFVRHLVDEGKCRHAIFSYFDSQNGFGAMIRSSYMAVVEKEPGKDSWKEISLEIL